MSITLTPTLWNEDSPRARRSDRRTSHAAADQSQPAMRQTKVRVLMVVRDNPSAIGSELNDLYVFRGSRHDWKRVAWDSPRKRAGELVADGYLEIVGNRTGANGTDESEYTLTDKGARVLSLGIVR